MRIFNNDKQIVMKTVKTKIEYSAPQIEEIVVSVCNHILQGSGTATAGGGNQGGGGDVDDEG